MKTHPHISLYTQDNTLGDSTVNSGYINTISTSKSGDDEEQTIPDGSYVTIQLHMSWKRKYPVFPIT